MAKRRRIPALTFEQELRSILINPTNCENVSQQTLKGSLNLGTRTALVKIILPKSLRELRRKPPNVFCSESYMKLGDEWHNSTNTGLCYVIDLEWRKYMGWIGKKNDSVIKESVNWLVAASINLISRHRVATKKGYTRWPEKWNFWEHGTAGYEQYKKENKENE